MRSGYTEEFSWKELVGFRGASLPGYAFGSRGIELSRVFEIGSYRTIARKELGCDKDFSMIIQYLTFLCNIGRSMNDHAVFSVQLLFR
jgi:hypothetical protein